MTQSKPEKKWDILRFLEEETEELVEHLHELRGRLIIGLMAFFLATIVGWFTVPIVLKFFTQSVDRLIFVAPAEAFFARFKIAAVTGALLSLPVFLHQAWKFILPALFPDEERFVRPMIFGGLVLFFVGLLFGLLVVYPLSLSFFLNFGTEGLRPAITISQHLTFFLGTTLSFGLAFQLPLILLAAVQMRIVGAGKLREMRKPALFFAFVVSTLLTPSDVVSQFLMAIPLFLLYELTIVLAPHFERKPTEDNEGGEIV